MFNLIKSNVDLDSAYIKGETKKIKITLVTFYNGLMDDKFTIYKDDEKGNSFWFIKIMSHRINVISSYY